MGFLTTTCQSSIVAGSRSFERWLVANDAGYVPHLPERTRLFRLLDADANWTNEVWAKLTCRIKQYGLVVAWEYGGGGRMDTSFQHLIEDLGDAMVLVVEWEGFILDDDGNAAVSIEKFVVYDYTSDYL